MNKILAIKGHLTRGNEIIEILEMFGGIESALSGCNTNYIYYVDPNYKHILVKDINNCNPNEFTIFTFEEFIEKYPYKVGDKVLLHNQVKDVKDIGWDSNNDEVIYTLETNINGTKTQYQVFNYDLQPYKKESYEKESCKEDMHTPPGITINGEKLIVPNGYTVKRATADGDNLIVEYVKNKSQSCQEKFDITTLKYYDKVLVRQNNDSVWEPQVFSYLDINLKNHIHKFVVIGLCSVKQCILYEGNEHLAETTNNCDEYYKTWE